MHALAEPADEAAFMAALQRFWEGRGRPLQLPVRFLKDKPLKLYVLWTQVMSYGGFEPVRLLARNNLHCSARARQVVRHSVWCMGPLQFERLQKVVLSIGHAGLVESPIRHAGCDTGAYLTSLQALIDSVSV